jgi:uncharacterized membrane protein
MRSYPQLLILALLLVGLAWAFWFTQLVSVSLAKLGLSPEAALLVLLLSLFGGYVNIPISRRRVRRPWPDPWRVHWPWELRGSRAEPWWGDLPPLARLLFYEPPVVREQVIAVNLGGAVVPLLMGIYLLPRAPLLPVIGATAGVALVCYAVARPAWPFGIVVPTFVPPLAAAALALLLAPEHAPPVAYIAGTLGTLIGADLLHLPELRRFDAQLLSIGGAGVHDAIFFAGLVAVLLA